MDCGIPEVSLLNGTMRRRYSLPNPYCQECHDGGCRDRGLHSRHAAHKLVRQAQCSYHSTASLGQEDLTTSITSMASGTHVAGAARRLLQELELGLPRHSALQSVEFFT
ncbi:hypothetical protein HPP92_029094 [Vanilla planifolia]|uniref:Uncharacterized protein n=1 Tax=Vanilla planifolia TaxID=51239 RepID=A0A835U2H2_VANPL|nr:hypothetical protein HPP92_029094 [Vanilla planifolia]KAG0445932.1 hypothetical protein HPP92_029083 [Vanilla planifolia]